METVSIWLSPQKRKLVNADDKRALAAKHGVGYAHVSNVIAGFKNNLEILADALEIAEKKEKAESRKGKKGKE